MKNKPILVRKIGGNGSWSNPDTSAYSDESHLQELLANDPTRIPGIESGSHSVRELPTSAGPIDICVLSPNGELTVVECKLEKNSEKRRMVIGQVLDYASSIREQGIQRFCESWRSRDGVDLDEFLEGGAFENLEANITSGSINLCLAVDRIDDNLKRLVEYLNLITQEFVRVTALQLSYARYEDTEILIPEIFGMEIAHRKSSTNGEEWTWESFVDSLASQQDKDTAKGLYSLLQNAPNIGDHKKTWFGARPRGGIFFHIHGQRYAAFQLWQNSANELLVFGNWKAWPSLRNDARFAELAEILGQSHMNGSKSVKVSNLNLEEFWEVAVKCDEQINSKSH